MHQHDQHASIKDAAARRQHKRLRDKNGIPKGWAKLDRKVLSRVSDVPRGHEIADRRKTIIAIGSYQERGQFGSTNPK